MEIFLRLSTQWHGVFSDMNGYTWQGLNYTAVESVLRMLKIQDQCDLFRFIQVMETAALGELRLKKGK